MEIIFKGEGLKELANAFEKLPGVTQQKLLNRTLRKQAKGVQTKAIALAPMGKRNKSFEIAKHTPGMLKRSIKVTTAYRRPDVSIDSVYVKAGRKRGLGAFYAHFVEYGHALWMPVGNRGRVKYVDDIPAQRFMAPALNGDKAGIIAAFAAVLSMSLQRELNKLAKQGGS